MSLSASSQEPLKAFKLRKKEKAIVGQIRLGITLILDGNRIEHRLVLLDNPKFAKSMTL